MDESFYDHPNAVWYQCPHYTLILPLPGKPGEYEQFITEDLGDNSYRLLCIPFFMYDLALGDIVWTDQLIPRTQDQYRIKERSGRFVFRVWFENPKANVIKKCLSDLQELGALVEKSSRRLYGIDAANAQIAQAVADYLMAGEQAGRWVYETGQSG